MFLLWQRGWLEWKFRNLLKNVVLWLVCIKNNTLIINNQSNVKKIQSITRKRRHRGKERWMSQEMRISLGESMTSQGEGEEENGITTRVWPCGRRGYPRDAENYITANYIMRNYVAEKLASASRWRRGAGQWPLDAVLIMRYLPSLKCRHLLT